MNRQQMSAYNADEIDEEKTRQRRWRAQDIEGRRNNPTPTLPTREGGQSGISNPPCMADTKREMPNEGITPHRHSTQGEGDGRERRKGDRDAEEGDSAYMPRVKQERRGEKRERMRGKGEERERKGESPEYRREQDTHRKQGTENPPLYERTGDFFI